jgi:hypothetical protein
MWDMKLAVIPLPNERSCEFVMKKSEVPPRIIFISSLSQGVVLVVSLLCVAAVVYAFFRAGNPSSRAGLSSATTTTASKQIDGKRPLVPGELVVLNGGNPAQVQRVAAGPKQAVLVRQGNELRGIYMAGESRYVVLSGTETRIVSADQVRAVVSPRN